MRPLVKGTIATAVLVLATVVALLPQLNDRPVPSSDAGGDPADVTAAREAAALAACPGPEQGDGEVAALAGVRVSCLADGSTVRLGRALAGEVTLVNVWATWCPPCRDELRVLDDYANRPGAVRVLGVQVASEMYAGLRMLAELDVQLPVVHDGSEQRGPVRAALKVPATLPASYVISANGTVRFVERPRVFHTVEQVRAAVANYGGSR